MNKYFNKNLVLIWNHDYSKPPIGKIEFVEGIEFDPETMMFDPGYIKRQDGSIELLEISVVPKK